MMIEIDNIYIEPLLLHYKIFVTTQFESNE
jgi:hypothetical protein